ncbi:hypothetical protein [Pseudomonas urmiensis]|uniref:hypothetical protein n=1 Tax=Pseudomonas urmiensis TaxID=2745493 RepID=UPI0034D74362
MSNEIVEVINRHNEEIRELKCLVVGLLRHIKETQGEDSAFNAISHARQVGGMHLNLGEYEGII